MCAQYDPDLCLSAWCSAGHLIFKAVGLIVTTVASAQNDLTVIYRDLTSKIAPFLSCSRVMVV